jgi:MoxR-like ATPase
MNYESQFEAKLLELFPDVASEGVASRKQLVHVMDALGSTKYPSWLMHNKVGRGLYAIAGGQAVAVEEKEENVSYVAPVETKALVPLKDKNYVAFGNHKDVDLIVKSGLFYPTYITGPTGNGKSTMVEQVCANNKKPLIRVNLNMMTDEEQLIGSKTLVDGNVEVVEGPVLIAMRSGCTLLLDEIDAGGANTLLCLQPILEGKPFYFKLKNELITPAAGFNVFATANTKGKGSDDGRYIGTNILNEAFLERFAVTLNQEYPSATVEKKIILNLMNHYNCSDTEFAETLVKWADAIRRTFEDGGVDELITTRRLTHVVRAFSIFKDTKKAVELCCNRFDDITRTAFIDLFDKISTEPEVAAVPVVEEVQVQATSEEVPF